jgi:hypothetical protein
MLTERYTCIRLFFFLVAIFLVMKGFASYGVLTSQEENIQEQAFHLRKLTTNSRFTRPSLSLMQVSANLYMRNIAGTSVSGSAPENQPASSSSIFCMMPFVAVDGSIYLPDLANVNIRKINPSGIISTFGGKGLSSISGAPGPLTGFNAVRFDAPYAIVGDTAGTFFYISDQTYVWRHLVGNITVSVYAHTPGAAAGFGGDEGPATLALLDNPRGLWLTTSGYLYITDTDNHRIRKVFFGSGIITTVAGTTSGGFNGDGLAATVAQLNSPGGIYVDTNGGLYIADLQNHRIRFVDTNNILTTIAGNGGIGFLGENVPAVSTQAHLYQPEDVKGDSLGNIYVAEGASHVVRVVDINGILSTVFGNSLVSGFTGGLSARTSNINSPKGLWVDSQGTVYFSDRNSIHRGVMLTPTSQPSGQPTGLPTSQPISRPSGQPTALPTGQPTGQPTGRPTAQPTSQPTSRPSGQPSGQPTGQPSSQPSGQPSAQPTSRPTSHPTALPTFQPVSPPTSRPSIRPTAQPSGQPFSLPTGLPSSQPISIPTLVPSSQPTGLPSAQPFVLPTSIPTRFPTYQPTILVKSELKQEIFAFFPIDGSSNDKSGNGNNGIIHEGVEFVSDRHGNVASAAQFDGSSSYVEVPNKVFFQKIKNFTVSFWIKPIIPQLTAGTFIFDKSPSLKAQDGWSFQYLVNNQFSFSYIIKTSSRRRLSRTNTRPINLDSGGIITSTVFIDLNDSVWSHITLVKDPQMIVAYQNGHLITNSSIKPPPVPVFFSDLPLIIGTSKDVRINSHSSVSYFSGQLDDVFLYNRALSQDEIIQIYEFATPTSLPSSQPSSFPTAVPSRQPTGFPSCQPSSQPTGLPSTVPTTQPSSQPSGFPSVIPTGQPTSFPSYQPSGQPTCQPSNQPSSLPSCFPSTQPTGRPSGQPTRQPTTQPTNRPSSLPSGQPSSFPTSRPSVQPSGFPSNKPTAQPSVVPSRLPTTQPSKQPLSVPTSKPTTQPSRLPTTSPSAQPSRQPTSHPSSLPSVEPSAQPSRQPSQQPFAKPSSQPSSQPLAVPTSIPSRQPTNRPSGQPSSFPSSFPTSQPTIDRMHCLRENNTFYAPSENRCVKCPPQSFTNRTGDESCLCVTGYFATGFGLSLTCHLCDPGQTAQPGGNCTLCELGYSGNPETHACEICSLSFYSSSRGQAQCTPCPAGQTTAGLGSTSIGQCVSPVPNFTMGFFALFVVVTIFSWYIVFGKFHRVSFERRVTTVMPNIEKCKQVLLYEEEVHYYHLLNVQEKRNQQQQKKYKFFLFAFLSFFLILFSIFAGFIFFTYQVFFTSLILWRGLKVNFKLSPILDLLAEGLQDITQYIGLPINLIYFFALPFLYLFQALASLNISLSSVSVTCSGSQAPIELLINCFILGLLIIIIRSDYQLLFNILLNNVNQRYLLNHLEQHLDAGNFWFSRYFYTCLVITALNAINPFQVGLRYCMGFVKIDSFAKKHHVSHEVSAACDQVPDAPYFDSFLGYTSTIFAWWLILPAVYCLAEVVVSKCKKIDDGKKIDSRKFKVKASKIFPAEAFIDESIVSASKTLKKDIDEGNSANYLERETDEEEGQIAVCSLQAPLTVKEQEQEHDSNDSDSDDGDRPEEGILRHPELPNHLSSKFPDISQEKLLEIVREGMKLQNSKNEKKNENLNWLPRGNDAMIIVVEKEKKLKKDEPNSFKQSLRKVTKRIPFVLAFYYYCKAKYFAVISIDLWVSNLFASWINVLRQNTLKAGRKEQLQLIKEGKAAAALRRGSLMGDSNRHLSESDLKQQEKASLSSSSKQKRLSTAEMKSFLSMNSTEMLSAMHSYDSKQLQKQKKFDTLWLQEHFQNPHALPSYYELSHVVQEELHDHLIQPFCSIFAYIGIGHFFTPTGRTYWKVVFNNYKIFLLVCFGVWTDEAVEAYGIEETLSRLAVDDRAFLVNNSVCSSEKEAMKKKRKINEKEVTKNNSLQSPLSGREGESVPNRRFSAQILGFTFTTSEKDLRQSEEPIPSSERKEESRPKQPDRRQRTAKQQNMREILPNVIAILICSRVILFQIVPSLVLFSTISMTLASFPLLIFNEFLADTLPPLIIWGVINREMAIDRELESFIALRPQEGGGRGRSGTQQQQEPLNEEETIAVLCEEYSWRLSLRGIILFWNESRLLQFFHSSLALFFSFLLLIYTPELLVYLVVILALLIPFFLSQSLVFLLYLGNSLDLKDADFPNWMKGRGGNKKKETAAVCPVITPEEKDSANDDEDEGQRTTRQTTSVPPFLEIAVPERDLGQEDAGDDEDGFWTKKNEKQNENEDEAELDFYESCSMNFRTKDEENSPGPHDDKELYEEEEYENDVISLDSWNMSNLSSEDELSELTKDLYDFTEEKV